jgi:hypothetical protein
MKNLVIAVIFVLASGAAACKKRAPEPIPRPKADEAAQGAGASTDSVKAAGLLEAPGNYLKTAVGQVDKARAAKALFEKTAKQELDGLNAEKTDGN